MLHASEQVATPHPPHIIQRISPLVNVDKELDDKLLRICLESACQLVERNPVPWKGMESINRDSVMNSLNQNTLIGIFHGLMDQYTEINGHSSWLCKSMQNIKHAASIDKQIPNAKYLYLHRDVRDVCASFKKAIVGEKHVYHIAKKWTDLQNKCIAYKAKFPQKMFVVKYEDLLKDTADTLKSICNFLEINYTEEMLNFHLSEEAISTASSSSLWANLAKPMLINNSRKFNELLTNEEQEIILNIAGETMHKLGYLENIPPSNSYTEEQLSSFNYENSLAKLTLQKGFDVNDVKKRAHQLQSIQPLKTYVQKNSIYSS